MTERERFESWARQRWVHHEDFDQRIKAPSKYNNYEVQAAWEAWQERAAQPAPSVPDATWLPVPDKHPTFYPVDLQLADGSVLCGCVPQIDGDYWWEGPSGEVFIDPRYAPVTHWRLSAAPEARQ